jgi:DHA1 family inner membrane transport protein
VLGLIAMLSLWFALPAGEAGRRPNVRHELAVLKSPVVLLALLTTVLGAGAMFTLYTYIAPTLADITGASPAFITGMLVLIGLGFTLGNGMGGRMADRSLDGTLITFLVIVIIDLLAFPWIASTQVGAAISLLIFGVATFAVVPPLQMGVMRAATDAPGLASSVNVGAFNLGNAVGAAAGGAVISAGMGYAAVPIAGAVIAVAGLALVLVQRASNVRRRKLAVQGC